MGIRFEMRKRFFPTSLALLLVVGSLGHVFAAAFCPHRPGHDCCPTTTAGAQLDTQTQQLMQGMAMHTVANESMPMDSGDMPGMTISDPRIANSSFAISKGTQLPTSAELFAVDKLELPMDDCAHCMSHSGIQNAPVSSASVPNLSNKDLCSVPSPVLRFPARPAMTLTQIGLPGKHAPPKSMAAKHILLNVFLI